ncbi:MAG: hypothetical protein JO015_10085 [Verrucomicrobia bacterium]|nr:hypothetical protein [Verrucomicrobiota bacterium]
MNVYPDDPNPNWEGYENLAESPGEVTDPLEEPFSSSGRIAPRGDASLAEDDASELPPEETDPAARPADQDLTINETGEV